MYKLLNVEFKMSKKTVVEVSPFVEGIAVCDLEANASCILGELEKEANGILMNFVSVEEIDSKKLEQYHVVSTEKISGGSDASVREKVNIKTTVTNPNMEKVKKVLKEDKFHICEVSMSFEVPKDVEASLVDVRRSVYQTLKDEYVILSYDDVNGMKFEYDDGFYVSVCLTDHIVKLHFSAEYDWKFKLKMKKFDVMNFLTKLMEW